MVAIHRAGQRVKAKLGSVPLKVGDTLLLLADPGFRGRWGDRNDFLLVSRLGGTLPVTTRKAWVVGFVALGIVGGASSGIMPILNLSLLGAFLLVALKVLSPGEARAAVNLDVILVIAAAFGLGAAMQVSGLAEHLGRLIVDAFGALGPTGALLGVVLSTVILMTVITNNAAAVLMFPVAMATAQQLDLNPRTFAIGVAVAASASFLTPIAYQTNLMVYGPGGYRFGDYWRLGLPLTLAVVLVLIVTSIVSG